MNISERLAWKAFTDSLDYTLQWLQENSEIIVFCVFSFIVQCCYGFSLVYLALIILCLKKTKTAIFPCFSQLCYCYNSSMYNVSIWYLLCWSLKVNSKWKWQLQKEMHPFSESKILRYHNWLKFVTNFLDSSPLSF